jgi:serine/threonine-protein kinase
MRALESTPELAKYELIEQIGFGGMAVVYRARDRRLGREVAVKLIHGHLRENAEVARRFVSEARAVARLRHPNVVEVFDVSDETEPERYLVVELVRGTTLRALLTRHKRLPAELTAAIGLEVAAALTHAHEQSIVHRDVKPENVLIEVVGVDSGPATSSKPPERPRVKLTDFGIAKLLDAQGVTSTGQVLGSPAHMAPEQIEGGEVTPRADVFALGVMLYECMVGRLPFDGNNPAQVLRRVLEGVYPPAVREEPRVGATWSDVLDRALVHDESGRYESIEAFATAMRAALERAGVTEPTAEIEKFLTDQDAYASEFEPRLIDALVSSGERARREGDFPLAASEFNRALAHRPQDPMLLERASRLARRERLLRVARNTALGALLAGAALGGVALYRHHRATVLAARSADPRPPHTPALVAAPPAKPADSAHPNAVASATAVPAHRHAPPALREARHRPGPVETRLVTVDVVGPKGGYLNIDGVRKDTWFGVQHELTVGPHTFEFVPADADCCRPSPPLTRDIDEGDTVEQVMLTVAFRDARLRVDRSPQGTVRCRALFGGDLEVPGSLGVPMSRLSATGLCTLSPEVGEPTAPETKEVTLTAGQTTEISWP